MASNELNKNYMSNANFWKSFTSPNSEQDIIKIFQKHHNVNLNYMVNEINPTEKFSESERQIELPNFDNQQLHKKFATNYQMTFNDYIKTHKSSNIALYKYLTSNHVLKEEIKFSQLPKIVADMTIANFERSEEFSAHSIAFIEMLGFDSSHFRKFLRFLKLRDLKEQASFELSESQERNFESLRNIEAINDFHGQTIPAYLKKIMHENDWFKLIVLGQYLNFSPEYFLEICDGNFENRFVERNLLRAISSCESNSKSKSSSQKLSEKGKFLDPKFHKDLFSILLMSGCKNRELPYKLTLQEFVEMHESSDSDYSDLFKLSITFNDDGERRGWPLLSIFAAMTNSYPWDYCWINYLILSTNYALNENFTDFFSLVKNVSSFCVTSDCHQELLQSVAIFYPESCLVNLMNFICDTQNQNYNSAIENLRKFTNSIENENWIFETEEMFLEYVSTITLNHLKFNFKSTLDIYNVLSVLCKAKAYFLKINFHYLKRIFSVLRETVMQIEFNWLRQEHYNQELCDELVESNNFVIAVQLAELLKLRKEGIVYGKWMSSYEKDGNAFDFEKCQQDLEDYKIEADILVNFYIFVAGQVEIGKFKEKYLILKKALDLIKSHGLYPSDRFDRDQMEYDLVISYLKISSEDLKDLPMYHSEYFEVISLKNRNLIFHSFMELREFAQIDDLRIVDQILTDPIEIERFNDLVGRLLDDADLVQCLRLQVI
jgi:spatacsin